jgi:hypothetical protein
MESHAGIQLHAHPQRKHNVCIKQNREQHAQKNQALKLPAAT